jgi:DNA-binding response OmpR family regulator
MNNSATNNSLADIVVVDDNTTNLQVLMQMLRQNGYRVRLATYGQLALTLVRAKLPDLILLDILMPDMDGFEVCRRLKANERTKDIPVIFISTIYETMDKVTAFAAGGVDYITKPFEHDEVLACIQTHLRAAPAATKFAGEKRGVAGQKLRTGSCSGPGKKTIGAAADLRQLQKNLQQRRLLASR